jgi:hypothetical protein
MNSASTNLPEHLKILREHLQHPVHYERAFHYFLEEFGGDHDFIAMGEPERLPRLQTILDMIATRTMGKNMNVRKLHLSAVPGHDFHHGSASMDGRTVIVLFFERANQGLMAIVPGPRGGAEFARFSLPAALTVNVSSN